MQEVATEIVESFSKKLFQFLGLFPLCYDHQANREQNKISEFFIKCWSFLWIFFILGHLSVVIRYSDSIFSNNPVGKANDILKFSVVFVAYIFIIAESLTKIGNLRNILRIAQDFQEECKFLKVNFKYYGNKVKLCYTKKFMFILLMQFLVEAFVGTLVDSTQWALFWFANYFPAFVCRIRHLQYIYFLHFIQSHILIVQNELEKIVNESKFHFLSYKRDDYLRTLDKLQTIKTAHGILWKLTFEVNES